MDYRKIYNDLCIRGQIRIKEVGVFYEKHHIKPRSFGGKKNKENMTTLTLKEHYVAHLLLVAIYPDSPAMHNALWNMCNITPKNNEGYERYKPSSRTFERIRGEYSKYCSIGENNPRYGKPVSQKVIDTCRQRSIGNKWWLGKQLSLESRKKASESHKKQYLVRKIKQKLLRC